MDTHVDRTRTSQVSVGTTLVIIGVILLGQRAGWGPAWHFSQLWPLLLIGMGAVQLLISRGHFRVGYFWILTGVLFLLDREGLLLVRDSWPLFLVAAGVAIMFGRQRCARKEARLGDK